MRLGIVLDRFLPERGGTEGYLAGLAARLAARGHEVRVYCLEGRAPAEGVEIVPVATSAWTRAGRERELSARACESARADGCAPLLGVRHVLDADVYQPHGGTWAASVEARLAIDPLAWRRAARAAAHRLSPKHRFFAYADREVFARRRGLLTLAVSPLVRDDVLARFGAFAPRVEVLFPAIDLERIDAAAAPEARRHARAALGADERAARLVFVAHDFLLKGLRFAIQAFACSEAARAGATLTVIGRDRAAPFERLARRLGAAGRMRFLGERADATGLIAAADLLLHPTHYDPCALVTLEAIAAGVPVATTRRNGAAALLERGGGRVVDAPQDVAALAGAIDALLADRERAREAARAAGRALGWEHHLARLVPLLEEAGERARAEWPR